jgi:hypothetical protein
MKLSIASNYDPEIILRLAEYPLEEVYGKLPFDVVGGCRPRYMGCFCIAGFVPKEAGHNVLLSIHKGFRADELYRLLKGIENADVTIKKQTFSRLVAFIRFNGGSQ